MNCEICNGTVMIGGDNMSGGDYWTHNNYDKDKDHQIKINGVFVDTGKYGGWIGANNGSF